MKNESLAPYIGLAILALGCIILSERINLRAKEIKTLQEEVKSFKEFTYSNRFLTSITNGTDGFITNITIYRYYRYDQ